MKTYFIRHTDVLLVRKEDIQNLWNEDRIAVHYPPRGEIEYSLERQDHKKKSWDVIARFLGLSINGGYVWAEYYPYPRLAKIGRIRPGRSVEPFEATWIQSDSRFSDRAGKTALLKSLKLSEPREVRRDEFRALLAGRPRQGTLGVWRKAGSRMKWLLEREAHEFEWRDLTTALQEAVCAEFLRERQDIMGLPLMTHLLLPVGRTLEEIDIYGLSEDGREVLGQVTYHRRDTATARRKVQILRASRREDRVLVFFCRCPEVALEDEVLFVPVKDVFAWAEAQESYWERITDV